MSSQFDKSFAPPADIYSTDTAYKIFFSVSDIEKGILELDYLINARELTVTGTLNRPAEFAGLSADDLAKVLVHEERPVGKFQRTVKIPDQDPVNYRFPRTAFDNGVLA